MNPILKIAKTADAWNEAAASEIEAAAKKAISDHGVFRWAVSGGKTPRPLFGYLADKGKSRVDWRNVETFFVDERGVPADHVDSNYRSVYETLLSKVPMEPARIHRMEAESTDLDAAARRYEETIIHPLDLIILGVGADGHTASLFPGSLLLNEKKRRISPAEGPPPYRKRLTMTFPLLNAVPKILFLAAGQGKSTALRAILEGPIRIDRYPAQGVRPESGEVVWILDSGAASKLTRT